MSIKSVIDDLAATHEISSRKAEALVRDFVKAIHGTLVNGEDFGIPGFGTFTIAGRGAKTGRNPQTGEALKIKATVVPKFKAGATLKRDVANSRKAKAAVKAKAE